MISKHIAYLIFRTRDSTGTRVIFDHASALRQVGHTVSIYTLFGNKASWYPKGITTKSVLSFFNEVPADVLIATFWPTAYVVSLLPAKRKFYMVMGWEEAFHSLPMNRFFARFSYKLPLKKVAVSHYLKKRIETYTKKKNSVYTIPTYIAEAGVHKTPKPKNTKKVVILSVVSWYNKVKGIDLLEKAVRKLKEQGATYSFVLVSREEKSYSSAFDAFYPNPSKTVLRQLYSQADVLLATSRNEGFYIPGLEAMGNGCLLITTNSGGITEYVRENENAIVVKRVSDLWKKNVLQKVLKNKYLRTKLRENGYKTAATYKAYTLQNLGKDLEAIYFTKDEQ